MRGGAKRAALACPQLQCYNMCMNKPLKLIPIGNSTGAVFPKELLQDLGVGQGDTLFPVRTPNGVELRAGGPRVHRGYAASHAEIMRAATRGILRELAK